MDQHIHSLAEAVLVTAVESTENNFTFPIIDAFDRVWPHSPRRHAADLPLSIQVVSCPTSDPLLRWKCSLALDRVCSTYGILPTRYPTVGNLVVAGDGPKDYGGSAEVWSGEVDGRVVAVKATRRYSTMSIPRAREVSSHRRSIFLFAH